MSKPDDMRDPQPVQPQDSVVREIDRQLAIRAKAGDLSAREELIVSHLPLVEKLLIPFMGKGVPEDVLYQEGCYGLILAVDRFDPEKGVLLDTYASYYVNKYLHRALVENYPHPIVLKSKSSKHAKCLKEAVEELTMAHGNPPSVQELADYVGISYESTLSLLSSTLPILALDNTDTEDWIYGDLRSRGAEDEALSNLNELCLDDFPASLTKREETILTLYFGFAPAKQPHNFTQIAKALGISFDTVSSDYHKAIDKLRAASRPQKNPE